MTHTDTTYNGWKNYETWSCALWLDNEEGTQKFMQELAREAFNNPCANQYMTLERRRVNTLADQLKAFIEDQAEAWKGDQASFFADIFNAALQQVDYREIAEHYLEDVEEEV